MTGKIAVVPGVVLFLTLCSLAQSAVLPLEKRLGGLAYYDPNLDITWAANANLSGVDTWDNQMAWVASLSIGGISGWRLPSADVNGDNVVVDCYGGGVTGCSDNEMGFLFWEEGISAFAPKPFSNVRPGVYWSGTSYASDPASAWNFRFSGTDGSQLPLLKDGFLDYAWAVRDGDVGAVPLPAALWLFGSGLLGLIAVARRKC